MQFQNVILISLSITCTVLLIDRFSSHYPSMLANSAPTHYRAAPPDTAIPDPKMVTIPETSAESAEFFAALSPECRQMVQDRGMPGYYSQYGQDWFVYNNFFRGQRKGFYLDVGANSPIKDSNTYFFDKCLGWQGICVEASSQAAMLLAQDRTCTIINKCVSDKRKTLNMVDNGSPTSSMGRGGNTVECVPLNEIFQTYNLSRVDYMSLDIEGSEISVLTTADFTGVSIGVLSVEVYWNNQTLSHLLFDRGFVKITDLGPDDIFVQRNFPLYLPSKAAYWRDSVFQARVQVQKNQGKCIDSMDHLDIS